MNPLSRWCTGVLRAALPTAEGEPLDELRVAPGSSRSLHCTARELRGRARDRLWKGRRSGQRRGVEGGSLERRKMYDLLDVMFYVLGGEDDEAEGEATR